MRERPTRNTMPQVTKFEKAMAYVAPRFADRVYRTRCKQKLGAYIGADKKRRTMSSWNTPGGDFNTDVGPELQTLREDSEDLYRNNMLATGAINTKAISVIGRGLTAQPRLDAKFLGISDDEADKLEELISRRWALFSESKFCSVNKRHNFRQLVSIAYLSSLVRGDSFILTPEKEPLPFFPYKLRFQLVEADRVCNKDNQADSDILSSGIEVDADGAPLFAHIMTTHPGNFYGGTQEWVKVRFFGEKTGRKNILQQYKSIRADQGRGVPVLAPVIEGLKQFGTLTQATVDAAVIQTFLSVMIETPDGGGLDLPPGGLGGSSDSVKLESGAVIDLAEGEVPHIINPTHPNGNFGPFAQEFYKQYGAAVGVPAEIITKYFQSSYTAAQGALMEAWREFLYERSGVIDNICQPAYELWLAEEVSEGRIPAPGFFTDPLVRAAYSGADWVGPQRGHIREDVQNKADGYAEDRGWKTAEQNTQERNGRWDRNHRQRVKEINKRKADGIITTSEDDGVEDIAKVDE